MIEYQLKDADGNTYDLNGDTVTVELKGSWTHGADSFEKDNRIVESSFLPGAQLIGEPRLMSRSLTLTVERASKTAWRDEMNELLQWINKARWLVDVTNEMELAVVVRVSTLEYDRGALKRSSSNTFEFSVLSPCWRGTTAKSYTGTVLADTLTDVAINNEGFLDTAPVITLETTAAVDSLQVFLKGTEVGIQVDDALFGTAGNLTMVIDCETGLVSIGDVNRNASVAEGTGFFMIPPGSDDLRMLFADEDVDYTVEFRERFYV